MRLLYLRPKNQVFLRFLAYFLVLTIVTGFSNPQIARAASLSAISDTMSRIKTSTNSSHAIKFTTQDAIQTTGDTIAITFPADFNFTGKTTATVTFTHGATTGAETTETINNGAPDGTNWGGAFSGTQNRTFTLTAPTDGVGAAAVAASDKLIISYTSANATNGTTETNYVATITVAGSTSETGQFAIALIGDDQVVVSTTIDPYLTFTLVTNSVTLTKSGGGNPAYNATGYNQGAANTLAASTNAGSGYTISYNGDTLKNGGNSITAMAGAASATNTSQFGINLRQNTTPTTGANKSGAGSGNYAADYGTVDNFKFVVNTTTPLATAGSSTASNTFTVSYIVNVTETTPAGGYSTTITYICTGNF